MIQNVGPKLDTIYASDIDVYKILKSLNVRKATGPDNISNHLLKNCALTLAAPLQQVINLSLSTGTFADSWKLSNTCPLYKAGKKYVKTNYRPVSLLSNISKVNEIIVFKNLYKFCKEHNILTSKNSGFKENDSTVLQCLYITHYLYESLDKGGEVCMIYLDVSKAFDRVWHEGLLFKLQQIGIGGSLLKWFKSYLSGRKQRVVIKGQVSKWHPVNAGVPQGSVLGPLLFLIYVNDIVDNISSHISLFADDTCLYKNIKSHVDIETLNNDLLTISNWGKNWLVNFNATKTKYMLFSRRKNKTLNVNLFFDDIRIECVSTHKHLGILFSDDLSWKSHVNHIVKKTSNRINVLKCLHRKLPRYCLERIFEYMVLPIIEYGDVVYDNMSNSLEQELELLQRQAAIACTGAYRHTKHDNLLTEIGWTKLQTRRKLHKMNIMYKIINDITPNYLKSIIPPTNRDRQNYNLRSNDNLVVPMARTPLYKKSFFITSIQCWNDLPKEIRLCKSYSLFKENVKSLYQNKKRNIYSYGKIVPCILQSRLRMGLSGLNMHRFSYNFIASPACVSCHHPTEDIVHYMLFCPKFTAQRVILITQLTHLLDDVPDIIALPPSNQRVIEFVSCLIKGFENLDFNDSTKLFDIVQKYIQDSQRFI